MYANAREVRRLESRILDPAIRHTVDKFVALSVDLSMLPKRLQGTAGQVLEDQAAAQLWIRTGVEYPGKGNPRRNLLASCSTKHASITLKLDGNPY